MIKKILISSGSSINRQSYIWNTLAGLLNASQSVLLLMIIMRTCSIRDAGIFSFAFSNASLMLLIANFGVRSFQVTDRNNKYKFNQYFTSRIITFCMMVTCSLIFIFFSYHTNIEWDKVIIVFSMCLIKGIDSIEDVFYGEYQKENRLDIGAKCQSLRYIFTIIIYALSLILTNNLLTSTLLTLFCSIIIMIYFIKISYKIIIREQLKLEFNDNFTLLRSCFPIFISLFLLFYIGNAPKYAIDNLLNQEMQAYYSFIAMPVFVIGLLNNFIYQPVLTKIADYFNQDKFILFVKEVKKQILIIFIVTIVVIMGGYFLGIPILSLLYKSNLANYKNELIILLIGGGMYALSNFLIIVLTTIRKQKMLTFLYIFAAFFAYFVSQIMVKRYEIMGAALSYTILMTFISISCFLLFTYYCKRLENIYD